MAAANAASRLKTGHSWRISAPDQMSTSAASARHRISMDRVLRKGYLACEAVVTGRACVFGDTFSSWRARPTSASR